MHGWCVCVGGGGVEQEGGVGVRPVERGWQPGRPRGLSSFSTPVPLSLPSDGPELWQKRASGWGDSLAGLEASAVSPSSLLRPRMTMSIQARQFKALSYADVEDHRLVPPMWGVQPSRHWCLNCFPSSPMSHLCQDPSGESSLALLTMTFYRLNTPIEL
jgi:hypothetical protein